MTTISIQGEDFLIDGTPTYPGRTFAGQRIAGLLFNVRAVQAIFDDANPDTRPNWAYPDTGTWDPDRNTDEFIAALPEWKAHGVLAFTVNIQGGGAIYTDAVYRHFDNNGYTPAGDLKPAYAERLRRIIAAADDLGMIVIVGFFYWVHVLKLDGEHVLPIAAENTMQFLDSLPYRNVLIEIANETELVENTTGYTTFSQANQAAMIRTLRENHPDFLYSTSHGGINIDKNECVPQPLLIDAADFLMPHGNATTADLLDRSLQAIRAFPEYQANPKPILINEDSVGIANLDVAWRNHVSWGYYDQGYGSDRSGYHDPYQDFAGSSERETAIADLSGYQTPPVNWGINTAAKRAFFGRVKAVTGLE